MLKELIANLPQNQGETAEAQQVIYMDISSSICSEQGCLIMLDEIFKHFFNDNSHFTKVGAAIVIDYIEQQLNLKPSDYK